MKKFGKKLVSSVAFAMLLLGSLTGVASAGWESETVTHNCNAKVLGIFDINFPISTEINAYVPDSVDPNEKYSITNVTAQVTIPQSAVGIMKGLLGWNNVEGTVSLFEVISDNKPQIINAADPVINIPSTPVPSNADLVFNVPASGTLTVGEFEAGDSGVINITAGNIQASFKNPSGGFLSPTINASCTPSGSALLTQISIN